MKKEKEDCTLDKTGKLLQQLEEFIRTKSVIGEPFITNDMTIIPIIDVSFGLGFSVKNKKEDDLASGGMGANITPNSFLIIRDEEVRLVSIKNSGTIGELLPLVFKEVEKYLKPRKDSL